MATTWKAPTWRMPNEKNQNKFESYSLDFSPTSKYIDINPGTSSTVDLTSFTISTWVKWTNSANSYGTAIRLSTSGDDIWLYVGRSTSLNFGIRFYLGSTPLDDADLLPVDEWVHIVARFQNDGNSMKIYVNGQEKIPLTANKNPGLWNTTSNNQIGASGTGVESMQGSLSQTCIFDYALSESQISSLYNSGSPINPMTLKPAPVAYYPLGGNASTGGDPLTIENPNTISVPNVAVPDASVFDFVPNDYINLNSDILFNTNQGFTFSSWVNLDSYSDPYPYLANLKTNVTDGIGIFISNNSSYAGVNVGSTDSSITKGRTTGDISSTFLNSWNNVVVTYNGNGANTLSNFSIYVNGLPVALTTTGNYSTMPNTANNIGRRSNSYHYLDGKLSNVQIWGTELSAPNVVTLYNNGQPLMTGTQPQAANLKAWYKLDQSANWEADTTGEWQIPDAVSSYPQSFDFDGSSFINFGTGLGNVLGDSYTGDLTFSTWIKLPPSSNNQKGIFCIDNINQPEFGLVNFTNQIWLYTSDNGTNIARFSTSIEDSNWHHLVLVYDADNASNTQLYIDNTPASKTVVNSQPASLNFNGDNTVLGTYYNTSGTFDLKGQLSNAQIWNTALSSSQIETLYNNGTPLTTAIATNNLKAWYKLNNNEKFDGTNWSVENQKYPASYESALSFPASNDYISIGNTTLGINTAIAISAWFKTSANTGYGVIIGEDNAGSKRNWHLMRKNDDIFFTIFHDTTGNNSTNITTSTINVSDNKWHHVVGTWDGTTNTDSMKVYFDGIEVGQATPGSTGINTESSAPWIGEATSNSSGYNNWTGELSNIAVYNTPLDSPAVVALYNNGTPETSISSSPISWWKLDNTTTGIQDSIGSNNGTNNGATKVNTFVSTETGISSGMTEQNLVNNNVSALNGESSGMDTSNLVTSTLTRQIPYNSYSLNFDSASSDYIDCGDSDMFSFGNDSTDEAFSVSAWIKMDTITNFVVLSKYGATASLREYAIGFSPDKIYLLLYDDNGAYRGRYYNTSTTSNDWLHIATTYNGVGGTNAQDGIKIYINGTRVDDSTFTSGSYQAMSNTTSELRIGSFSTTYADGKISNVSLFNEELTSTEVLKLYNSGVPGNLSNFTPSPIAWWSLGSDSYFNGANYICPDLVGTNNGTSSGMDANSLIGDAPNSTANGTSTNMTIDANLTGNAPNSSNNSFSVNMDYRDRVSGSGDVPG